MMTIMALSISLNLLTGGKATGGSTKLLYLGKQGYQMKNKIIALSVAAFCFTTLYAADDDSGFEIAAGVGEYFYDDSRLENASMGILSLAYKYDDTWSAEYIYGNPDTTFKPNGGDIDADWSAIRGLYHFNQSESVSTYLSAGIGSIDAFKGKDQVIVGLGVKMKMQGNLFWRLEGNYHADKGDTSLIAMLGYRFGGSSTPTPKVDKDSDNDGVFDSIDACQRTTAGDTVDHTGCTIQTNIATDIDTDMDGVFDHLDKCPNTPAKALVDDSGCQKELLKDVSVNLQINFDSDKTIVKSEYFSEIKGIAKFMSDYAGTSVIIEGHTDSKGKAAHNQGLSSRRAEAVAKVLAEQFAIDSSRITATGYGEDKPIADNATAKGRSENRRVVAVIKQQVKEKQWK